MKLKISKISKQFGSVKANKGISLNIESKKIHALLGENGAGKSTLVKIISGHYKPDSGEIYVDKNKLELGSTQSSINNGIGILSQDPLDFQNLTIKESFLVGSKKFGSHFREKNIEKLLNESFKKYEIKLNIKSKIKSLSIGERQQIELIRLLFENSKIIILDEPTNGFSLNQRKLVFSMLKKLSTEGYIVILVSHKLDEVFELCKEATILKNGSKITTIPIPYDRKKIIDLMFKGDKSVKQIKKAVIASKKESIHINLKSYKKGVTKIPEGNKIGVIGLQGSGNDQFIKKIFDNEVLISMKENNVRNIVDRKNIYYTPSDRLEKGLFSELTLLEHMALSEKENRFINWKKIKEFSTKKIKDYNIKGTLNSQAKELSGGNQQKLQLSLIPDEKGLLAIEQPTRGLDLNSTQSVWNKINERINDDICLFFSTTDIDEVWDQSDWIISFSGENITDISEKKKIKKSDIKYFISGIKTK
tara:strand:+ start:2066 stop:3493 length:1428 start_codon:yes stop_codon:yes gene_type:complete